MLSQAQGGNPADNNTTGVSISYGSQSSETEQRSESHTASASTVNAGRDIQISAAGSGNTDGDILLAEAQVRAEKTGRPQETVTEAAISRQIYDTHYEKALRETGTGTGGKYQQAITAATAAVQGIITGSPGAALSGAAAPYLAAEIKHLTTNTDGTVSLPENLLAHATVNAALALAGGQGKTAALAAGTGAASGEAAAIIATQIYGDTPDSLTEEQRQTVSALATLAAGLAGGITGDSTASTALAAQAGKTTAENNYLSNKQHAQKDKEIAECQTVACVAGAKAKWAAIDLSQDGIFTAGIVASVPAGVYDVADGIVKMAVSPVETYKAMKSLFNSDDVLGDVSDAVKQSYIDQISRMETEYQKAGASGSFNSGVEAGKLLTDIISLIMGGVGVVKGGVVLTEKIIVKAVGNRVLLKGADLTDEVRKAAALSNDVKYVHNDGIPAKTPSNLISQSSGGPNKDISRSGSKKIVDNPFDDTGKLKPNVEYTAGEYKYNYQTDGNGRISNWRTDNLQLTKRKARFRHNPNSPGKMKGDQAGHLAGDRFGGSPELNNIVSQSKGVNLSSYKKIENEWAKSIKEGKKVTVNVDIKYDGSGLRPVEFNVNYTIDGRRYSRNIMN